MGLPFLRAHSLLICSYGTARHEGPQTVCSGCRGPGHLGVQTKGHRCRKLHLYPLPRLSASCAPTEVPGTAPGSTTARLFEGHLGKSPRLPFSKQNSCLPTGKVLVFSLLFILFYFFKEKTERRQYNLVHLNQSAASQNLLGRAPQGCSVMPRSHHPDFGNTTSPCPSTAQLPVSSSSHRLAQVQLCKPW